MSADHICCNYTKKKNQVFIETKDGSGWRRRSIDKLKPNEVVIMCSDCQAKPADMIDHSHPWCDDFTLCEDCENKKARYEA